MQAASGAVAAVALVVVPSVHPVLPSHILMQYRSPHPSALERAAPVRIYGMAGAPPIVASSIAAVTRPHARIESVMHAVCE